jgi:hypothetical protein
MLERLEAVRTEMEINSVPLPEESGIWRKSTYPLSGCVSIATNIHCFS